jgi:hypothetical protein
MHNHWTMRGARLSLRVPGITGAHRAQSRFFVLRRGENTQALVDGMRAVLPDRPALYIAATRLRNDRGIVVRALYQDEPLLHTALRRVRDAAARTLLRETGTVVLSAPRRRSCNLRDNRDRRHRTHAV